MKKDETRIDRIVEMRVNDCKTLQFIADKEGVSRERIRQILKTRGIVGREYAQPYTVEKFFTRCPCGKEIQLTPLRINRHNDGRTICCSHKCFSKYNNPLGKPRKEYTKEDWSIYNKIRNDKSKEKRKEYYKNPIVKERIKNYQKKHPEYSLRWRTKNAEKLRIKRKERYHNDPEHREKMLKKFRINYSLRTLKHENKNNN